MAKNTQLHSFFTDPLTFNGASKIVMGVLNYEKFFFTKYVDAL